ncbi:MAG: hypothetical protein ACRD4Y_02455, partial [Candidatus Acidiferrales bacterium]
MKPPESDLEALKAQVAALTARVYRLEQSLGVAKSERPVVQGVPESISPDVAEIAPPAIAGRPVEG